MIEPGLYQMSFRGLTLGEAWRFSGNPLTFAIALVLKVVGALYLIWLAIDAVRHGSALNLKDRGPVEISVWRTFLVGVGINLTNPKIVLFFVTFLPQFVSAEEAQPLLRMSELSSVFMLATFVVFVGYGLFAASVREHVISRPRVLTWMRRVFAGAFAALGAKLALADR